MNKTFFTILFCLFFGINIFAQKDNASNETDRSLPPLGVAWGFLYGYPPAPPVTFIPSLNEMGIYSSKVYLFWHQIEPENDKYNWETVDFLLDQIKPGDQILVSIFSSSTWATKTPAEMLPPSPAKSQDDYYEFIYNLVKHCNGKIKFWQNDSEPNNPVYWNGSAEEFISEIKVFHKAVKDADPDASVVLGGYDGLFNPPDALFQYPGQEESLEFFRKAISEASDYFDLFDIRLYADPYTISYRIEYFKKILREQGKDQPIICTEYNGPGFFEFAQNFQYADIINKWQQIVASGDMESLSKLKNPLSEVYDKLGTLAPQTEMFMMGCDPALNEKYYRIQSRDIVMRNVFAFSSGVKSTMYWDLWHDTSDTLDMMTLMYGKHKLMEIDGLQLTSFYPQARTFNMLSQYLDGFTEIKQIKIDGSPDLFLFKVTRKDSGDLYIAWEKRDSFSGEDQPSTRYQIPWEYKEATAVDIFGNLIPVSVTGENVFLELSVTPVFLVTEHK